MSSSHPANPSTGASAGHPAEASIEPNCGGLSGQAPTIAPVGTELRITPDQWSEAISEPNGYQIVVAGPGAGKTEFLIRRAAHLINTEHIEPSQLVFLTFSRRSAAAIKVRLDPLITRPGAVVDVTTFHSLALRISETLNPDSSPMPLTTPEQVALVASVLAEEQPEDWPVIYRGILTSTPFATAVADFLMRCSERLLTPDHLESLAAQRPDWQGIPGLFRRYLGRLTELQRTDYGVLLADCVNSLRTPRGVEIAGHYQFLLVDEYQDTTPAQAALTHLLARPWGNLTVAGDPYQSIFSFRGADVGNVAQFSSTHPESRRIVLTDSFRVPEAILDSALRVVSEGSLPGGAGPVTAAPHPGRSEAYLFDQETAEAEWIASEVERAIVVEGVDPSRIAVLVRSKRQLLGELSRSLSRRKIPHTSPDNRLVDHPAITLLRDITSVARHGGPLPATTASEAAIADRAMRRILLGPLVGLSLGKEREIYRTRRRTWSPWSHVISEALPKEAGLAELVSDPTWATGRSAADGFWHLWTRLDSLESLVADPARAEWRQAWAAFGQALSRQSERDAKLSLVDYFALTEEEDFEAEPMLAPRHHHDRVVLTTLHQAKGLEFDVVFIANATEGVFPDLQRSRSLLRPELLSPRLWADPEAQHRFALQEEMRLAYTAMTRASSRVVWSSTVAGVDQAERRPSRFLLAASGVPLDQLGSPGEPSGDPVSQTEMVTMLRRWLLDPSASTTQRLAAARVLGAEQTRWDPSFFAGVPRPGPDRPILGDFYRLSPSQGEMYEKCPRRYALERRLGLSEGNSPHATFGSLCHRVLELAEAEVIGSELRHAELRRVLAIVDEVWESADFGSPPLNQAWKAKAVAMFETLYAKWPGHGPVVAVEEQVTLDVDGVPWVGVIDRVEKVGDGVGIVDLKTSTTAPSTTDAAESLQLGFYALARDTAPVKSASMWFPRVRSVKLTTRKLDIDNLDGVRERITNITKAVGNERWEARIGSQCKRCEFRNTCPLWPEGRGGFLP